MDVSEELTVSLFYREDGGNIFLFKIGKFLNRKFFKVTNFSAV
jgi:hypothetical protein